MATLSSAGIGSGLDVKGIVEQLVAVERKPEANRILKEQTATTTKISGLASMKGALSAFQNTLSGLKTTEAFAVRSAVSGDEDILTATAKSSAAAASYDIEVVSLAKGQQIASTPFVGGPNAIVGTGTLTLQLGAGAGFSVVIDAEHSSLADIRDAINSSTDNPGVRAAIVQATDGSHLVLSSANTGAANTIRVTSDDAQLARLTYDPAAANTANFTIQKPAQDAVIKVAGFEHRSATNVVTDAIEGVTLTLKKESEVGETLPLDIKYDTDAATARIKNFVSQYNAMQSTIAGLQSYDSSTEKGGPLLGDALARNVTAELRRNLSDPVSGLTGDYQTLASLGITTQKDGTLTIDDNKLAEALGKDFGAVARVFGSENGVAARMAAAIETRLSSTGDFTTRSAALDKRSKQMAKDQEVLDARMERLTARYTDQFSKLDTLLSQLQSTSAYLTQQLASLPGISS